MKKRLKLKVIATAAVSAGVVSLAAVSLAQDNPRGAMQQQGVDLLNTALTAGCAQVTTDTDARQTVDTTFQAALNSRCSVAQ